MAVREPRPLDKTSGIAILLLASFFLFALIACGRPQADKLDTLIEQLKSKDTSVRNEAAGALGEINSRSAAGVLTAALKDKNLEVVAAAYRFFICRGEEDTEDVLIAALNEHGDESTALGFLDCGNPKLEAAAVTWAEKRGLEIPTFRDVNGSADLRWGSGR